MLQGVRRIVPKKIEQLLETYTNDLEQAWANAGEDPLTISFSAKIAVVKGKNIVEVSISFVKEKVKDTVSVEWNPRQTEMFETLTKADEDLRKKGMTMTIKAEGHEPVTLGSERGIAEEKTHGTL